MRRLLAAVALLTVAFCLLAIVAGESAIVALFGEPFRLAGGHLAILGLASGAYLLAASSAAALTVLARHADVLYAWLAGLSTLGLVAAGVSDTLLRVELSLLAGCSVAAVVLLGTLLRQVLSRPS